MAERDPGKNLLGAVLGPKPETGGGGGAYRPKSEQGAKKVFERGGGGRRGPRTDEQDAADTVEDIKKGGKDRDFRIKLLKESSKKTDKALDQAKADLQAVLGTAGAKEADWLVAGVNVDAIESADVAQYLTDVATNENLRTNPDLLMVRTLKLVYATGSESAEARKEVSGFVTKVREKVKFEAARNPDPSMTLDTFDKLFYGKALPDALHPKAVYNATDPKEETITDPELIRMLQEINYKISIDSSYIGNVGRLERDREQLLRRVGQGDFGTDQVREAVNRINTRITEAQVEDHKKRLAAERRGGGVSVTFEEASKHLNLTDAERATRAEQSFDLVGFDEEEARLLMSGQEGLDHWFSDFMAGIFGNGREQAHPELPDQMKFNKFEDYVKWLYGPKSEQVVRPYKIIFNDRGKQEWVLKTLAYMPGKIEDKLNAFRRLLGADLDFYATHNEWAKYAIGEYQNALPNLMARKQAEWQKAVDFVKNTVPAGEIPTWLSDELQKEGVSSINYDQFYVRLRKGEAAGKIDTMDPAAQQALRRRMEEVRQKIDTVGYGVMLYDSDVLVSNEVYMQWTRMEQKLSELEVKISAVGIDGLTPEEKRLHEKLPSEITKKKELCTRLEERENVLRGQNEEASMKYQSYSPLEAEIRDNLEAYLRAEKIITDEMQPDEYEWKLRDAIWAARMHLVGSGRMVDVNSYMVTKPKYINLESYQFDRGKYTMISPFMEDIQRIINPNMFAERFTIGGPMGERLWAMLRSETLGSRNKKKDWEKIQLNAKAASQEEREFLACMQIAEEEMGVSFSEMLDAGFLSGGGYFDNTTWRIEAGLYDEVKREFFAAGYSSKAWENQGMGIQLLLGASPAEKERILRRMAKRSPLVFLQFMAGKDMTRVLEGAGLDVKEQQTLQRVLSMAQMKLWNDESYFDRDINMGGVIDASKGINEHQDFDDLIVPLLAQFGKEGDAEKYLRGIRAVQARAETYIPAWSKRELPMTIALGDIDWSKSYFAKLGTAAMDRRGRDMGGMAQARDIMFEIFSKPEFLSPKKTEDALKKFLEFERALNSYLPTDAAEKATQKLFRVWLRFNENKAARLGLRINTLIGWIPGMTTLCRRFGETEFEHMFFGIPRRIGGIDKKTGKYRLDEFFGRHTKIKDFPKSVAEMVSLSVRYLGPEGAAWDDFKIGAIINDAQRMGLFAAKPELANELRREFHATNEWKFFYGVPRKYLLMVIAVSIALAATQAVEEEKKKK